MKEFVEKLIGRLEECQERYDDIAFTEMNENGHTLDFEYAKGKKEAMEESIENVNQLAEEYNNGWIPCDKKLPPQPKENPIFDNKPLELYFVTIKNQDYPFRAFWNGKFFTDGWGKVDAIAWQPLPEPYQKGE